MDCETDICSTQNGHFKQLFYPRQFLTSFMFDYIFYAHSNTGAAYNIFQGGGASTWLCV